MTPVLAPVFDLVALGGPVVGLLGLMSVVALAAVLWKIWQFWSAGIGRHGAVETALSAWDAGRAADAEGAVSAGPDYLRSLLSAAFAAPEGREAAERVDAMAEAALGRLESGFRLLDAIAQTAPLLGLFGTVIGMIEAFQALQGAGSSVDPSILAGGIWVALLTTAVGLAVAMPTGLALTWFESRVARERLWLEGALARIRSPQATAPRSSAPLPVRRSHGG
jgi:biopolymer transport protein ExbB